MRAHSLNEKIVPIDDDLFVELVSSDPVDAVEVARSLPLENRAALAEFCYSKRHLSHLGLLLASTCDKLTLCNVFGPGGEVVYRQSRDVDGTLTSRRRFRETGSKITLAKNANVVPLSSFSDVDVDDVETE